MVLRLFLLLRFVECVGRSGLSCTDTARMRGVVRAGGSGMCGTWDCVSGVS